MKKHYETHVEDTDKLISVAGPVLDYKSWYEQYRKLMEEQAQRKYGLYTPTSEGDDDFPSISGMIARYSALGLTNEQMAENPIWVDKTGNEHDLQMKNFAWGGMSGVGGYADNWNSSADWAINSYKTYPWLFPDQAWTVVGKTNEDEDRATIANITGNGNDLVLSNFGFAEGSGYGLYGENYNGGRWVKSTDRADITWTSYSVNITSVKVASTQLYYQSYPEQPSFTVPSYKIKVYGLKDGQTLSYKQVTSEGQQIYKISEDGIYTLPSFLFKANGDWYGFTLDKIQETCDITIEQIPEYEGYLVTDGVDDKITSSIFEMGNDWTVIGDWELINTGKKDNAGIVKFDSIIIYNYNPILINIKNGRNNLIPDQNTVNAICSDGRIYSKDWKESIYNEETESTSKNLLTIGYSGNSYTKIAFKNLAIYPTVLSKEDCIKAYNYLQTLKAK